jgi:hypothetical protein
MNFTSRRVFLKRAASVVFAGAMTSYAFNFKDKYPSLSFSTLGCPDWPFGKITDFAVQHAYQGIEVRGLLREMDLQKCPEFSTAQNRSSKTYAG